MRVIPLKIPRKSLAVGSKLHHWIWGTTRRLEQLMTLCGLQSVRCNHNAQKTELLHVRSTNSNDISSQKIKTLLFSSDGRKIEVLRSYCRGKGPGSYIGPQALSKDTNGSEDKQIIIRYSQTRSPLAQEGSSKEYILLGLNEQGVKIHNPTIKATFQEASMTQMYFADT